MRCLHYITQHFFNKFKTNEDITMRFGLTNLIMRERKWNEFEKSECSRSWCRRDYPSITCYRVICKDEFTGALKGNITQEIQTMSQDMQLRTCLSLQNRRECLLLHRPIWRSFSSHLLVLLPFSVRFKLHCHIYIRIKVIY